MRASSILIDKLKSYESLKLNSYRCPAGILTIGWGHTNGVREGQVITMLQAESLLKGDLLPCETFVNNLKLNLTQGKFDALVDFAFNCGTGNLRGSTLLKKVRINAPVDEIQEEFRKWNKSKGKVLVGLVRRREWEAQRYAQ